jgi:hypothetical protein
MDLEAELLDQRLQGVTRELRCVNLIERWLADGSIERQIGK